MSDYTVVNPATGETLASYPGSTDAEVEAALAAADAAYRDWGRNSSPAERAEALRAVARLHRERRDELAAIIVREMGKPLEAALGEVDFAADITEYNADHVDEFTADQPLSIDGDGTALIRRSPLGVLLGIMPWNFPYYQVARFAAPNLAVGNTILLKHAPQCPESAAAIASIYADAGFPAGAYADLRLTNEQAAAVIADPRVQGVSVTGSERAGAAVAEVAGRNLKKVALELGGSDPFILLSTDDLDAAAQAAVDARLDNTGQSCNAAKRFIVVDGLYDAFLEKFTAGMAGATLGDPFAEDTVLGPLSSLAAAERLEKQVDAALAQGATRVLGGDRDGAFFLPGDRRHPRWTPTDRRHPRRGRGRPGRQRHPGPPYVFTTDAEDGRLPRGVLRPGRRGLPGRRRGRGRPGRQRHPVRPRLVRVHHRRRTG